MLLKALIIQDKAFMKYAIVISTHKKHFMNKWIADILRSAIISPSLPELPTSYGEEEMFYKNLSEWFEQNNGKIQFINAFLFEKLTSPDVQ